MRRNYSSNVEAPSPPCQRKENKMDEGFSRDFANSNLQPLCSYSVKLTPLNAFLSTVGPASSIPFLEKQNSIEESQIKPYDQLSSPSAREHCMVKEELDDVDDSPRENGSSHLYSNQNSCTVKEEPDEIEDTPIQHAPPSPIPNNGGYRYHIAAYNIRNCASAPMKTKEPVSFPFNEYQHFMRSYKHDHCYTKVDFWEVPLVERISPSAKEMVSVQETASASNDVGYVISDSGDDHQFKMPYPVEKRCQEPCSSQSAKAHLYERAQCRLCSSYITVKGKDWHAKSAHAIIHTNIERYHCPICELFSSRHRSEVARHIRRIHEINKGVYVAEYMSPEDILHLRNVVEKCFGTQMNSNGKLQTQLKNFYAEQLEEANKFSG